MDRVVVELLLKHKADVSARTAHGWTPLHAAGTCPPLCIYLYIYSFYSSYIFRYICIYIYVHIYIYIYI